MKDEQAPGSRQPLSMAALRRAVSDERLAAYSSPDDHDDLDAVARYTWNVALGCALSPSLHAVEVTLRNNLFTASQRVVDESVLHFVDVPCWLDATPTLLYEAEAEAVESTKVLLRRSKKPMTTGQLIANLPFGFWVRLCRSPYEQGRAAGPGLWPNALQYAFPFLPRDHRTRGAVLARLDEVRELRNRVFHHEPIWNRDLIRNHRRLLDALDWMNKGLAAALAQVSMLEEIYDEGPSRYRGLVESVVRL